MGFEDQGKTLPEARQRKEGIRVSDGGWREKQTVRWRLLVSLREQARSHSGFAANVQFVSAAVPVGASLLAKAIYLSRRFQ